MEYGTYHTETIYLAVTRTQAGKPRNCGSIPGRDKRLHKCLEQLWGPANLLFNREQGALFPWAKWLGHEADHSPQSNAKKKMSEATSTLPHTLETCSRTTLASPTCTTDGEKLYLYLGQHSTHSKAKLIIYL